MVIKIPVSASIRFAGSDNKTVSSFTRVNPEIEAADIVAFRNAIGTLRNTGFAFTYLAKTSDLVKTD